MKILVKLPTRSRPQKCFKVIEDYIRMADGDITIMVNYDNDDHTMNNPVTLERLLGYSNVIPIGGTSANKIHAVNRDMHKAPDFDILVLASDDMVCQVQGWDTILRQEMTNIFPDMDGVLFHWDGDPATRKHNNGRGLNTMCILGKKYLLRFGYIYHPSYMSLWCDNEFTDVADMLDKQFRSDIVLFKHIHHSNTPGMKPDVLMQKTQSYYTIDGTNYQKRKSINFGL